MDVVEILRTQVGRDLLIKEESPVDSITLDSQLAPDAFIKRVIPMLVIMDWIKMMPPLAIVSGGRGAQLRGQDKFPSPNPEFNAELLLGVIGWTYTEHGHRWESI